MLPNNPLFAVPIRFGLFAGALSVILFLVLYFLELNPFVEVRLVDMVLIPIFLFFGIRDFRDFRNGRVLHYWQGMTVGFILYLLMAVISALWILVFTGMIDPGSVTLFVEDRIALLADSKESIVQEMGIETYDKSVKNVSSTSGFDLAIDDFLKKSIIGLMLTIMISIILRKQPK